MPLKQIFRAMGRAAACLIGCIVLLGLAACAEQAEDQPTLTERPTEEVPREPAPGEEADEPLPSIPAPAAPSLPGTNIWLEAQAATLSVPMQLGEAASATGNRFIWASDAARSAKVPPSGGARFTFTITEAGSFAVWGRFHGDKGGSFWIRVNGGEWLVWEGVVPEMFWTKRFWTWRRAEAKKVPHSFVLGPGKHTLELRHRESGVRLDRLLLTTEADLAPTGRTGADVFDERLDGLRRHKVEIPFVDQPKKTDGHHIWFHPSERPQCVIYTWITPGNIVKRLPDVAQRNRCVFINRNGGDGKIPGRDYMLAAFEEVKALSGYDVAELPRVLMGTSRGTRYTALRAEEEPELAIAVIAFAGGNNYPKVKEVEYRDDTYCGPQDETPHPLDALPTVTYLGEHDPFYNDEYDDGPDSPGKSPNYILRNALHGLRQGLTAVVIEPGTGHSPAKASHSKDVERAFIDAYLDAVIALRVPAGSGAPLPLKPVDKGLGWRGQHRDGWKIMSATSYELPTGPAAECWAEHASWLPNEETARLWQGVWQVKPFGPYMTKVLQP